MPHALPPPIGAATDGSVEGYVTSSFASHGNGVSLILTEIIITELYMN